MKELLEQLPHYVTQNEKRYYLRIRKEYVEGDLLLWDVSYTEGRGVRRRYAIHDFGRDLEELVKDILESIKKHF